MSDNAQGTRDASSSPFARSSSDDQLFRSNPFESGTGRGRPASAPTDSGALRRSSPEQEGARRTEPARAGGAGAGDRPAAGRPTAEREAAEQTRVGAAPVTASTKQGSDAAKRANAATTTVETKSTKTTTSAKAAPARRTRKARLRLSRIDPWSVMKTALMFSIAWGIITVVAAAVLWAVLQSSGAFESINRTVNGLLATPNSTSTFDLGTYITRARVLGFTALIAAADVVLFTALATLFSFLYNLSATVLGGLEVTLAED